MTERRPTDRRRAFTLVEILIVVVLLGILAAVVTVQMVRAREQTLEATLRGDLRTVRNQIELYKLHHGMLPGYQLKKNGKLSNWGADCFVEQLVSKTDRDGNVGTGDYGPYLHAFPCNPFAPGAQKANTVRKGKPNGKGAGWSFDPDTGMFYANDDDPTHQSW